MRRKIFVGLWLVGLGMAFLAGVRDGGAQFLPIAESGNYGMDDITADRKGHTIKGEGDEGTKGVLMLIDWVYNILRMLIGAVALALGAVASLKLVTARENEESITEAKNWFVWAAVGMVIFSLAVPVERHILSAVGGEFFLETGRLNESSNRVVALTYFVIKFLRFLLGGVAVYFMTASGVRMIMFGWDEENVTKQKKIFSYGFVGLIVFMLAPEIVKMFYGEFGTGGVDVSPDAESGAKTVTSLSNFLLYYMSPLALLALVIAAIMYIAPTGEETKEKAKKIVIAVLVAMAIAVSSWTIVSEIMSAT